MQKPLAYKLRPETLKDIIGQKHLLGEGKVITNMIENNKVFSMILYGRPGIGKTTLAEAICYDLRIRNRRLNAVINNKKDIDTVIEEAKFYGQLVLVMDEIHRLNKDKQDILLPHIESGLLILIGLTTINPYHSVNQAIRSRCQIFELLPLSTEEIKDVLFRAINLTYKDYLIDEAIINHIANISSGDARYALNLLEISVGTSKDKEITMDHVKEISPKVNLYIDKNEDEHYNLLSAFQKSIRGSDVDAALHYTARLIIQGDFESLYRRMLVIAYEDIGLGNPQIGPRVVAAIEACRQVGMPEMRIILGTIIVDMALSPKSNTGYLAINEAIKDIEAGYSGPVPSNIKQNPINYKYPHDYPNSYVKQNYMPTGLEHKKYYTPKETGKYERALKIRVEQLSKLK